MSFEITPFDNYDEFKVDPMSAVTKTAKKEIRRILDYAVKHSDISRKEYVSGIITELANDNNDTE